MFGCGCGQVHKLRRKLPSSPLHFRHRRELRQFVEATQEVVIASLRRFVGFEGQRAHVELMALVEDAVGVGHIFPLNPVAGEAQTTLRDCWEMGRRVVVLYGEGGPQRDNALFWPMLQACSTDSTLTTSGV